MMTRNLVRSLRLWLTPVVLWAASLSPACAQDIFGGWGPSSCGSCSMPMGCQTHHCPPPLSHCQEGAPIIRVKCGCPKPICNPCDQPGWGYFETCWTPWPWPPNYSHCPVLPPAATIALSGPQNQNYPYYGGQPAPQQPMRQMPAVTPNMPPVTAPPVPTTPVIPRPLPNPNVMPQAAPPVPGGGLDSLPVPRPDVPRPLPNQGAYLNY
jgi:hypothetical protein